MGNPVDLVIYINGVRHVVGKAWYDPAGGEIKAHVDDRCPQHIKDAIWAPNKNELSIVTKPPVLSRFDQLLVTRRTTTTTTTEEG